MSQTTQTPPRASALPAETGGLHWSDRLALVVLRQGTLFRRLGRMDRHMVRIAANSPMRVWRRIDRLDRRIAALCASRQAAAARLKTDLLPLLTEAELRAEYAHLGALLGRVGEIEAQIGTLEARLQEVWTTSLATSRTRRADLRAGLSRQKDRLAEIHRDLRLRHVDVSAHLVEFC